jgi:cyclophilin family peptidyl-prolyl cis-trans isomerase
LNLPRLHLPAPVKLRASIFALVVFCLARPVLASPPAAPSFVTATITSGTALTLSWVPGSADQLGFAVFIRVGTSGQFTQIGSILSANTTALPLGGATPGTTYQFVVDALNADGEAASTPTTVTMPGITSSDHQPAVTGQALDYAITTSPDAGTPTSINLSGTLPPGLFYNPATAHITGTPTTPGVYEVSMSCNYAAFGTFAKPLTFRVIPAPGAPTLATPIPLQTLTAGGPAVTLALNQFIRDPDAEKAVRFVTSKGVFNLALYATATPLTVSNFLNYVRRGDYNASIIHRALTNFVVQGGGFKAAAPNFTAIATDPSPLNEPGIANLRGTISMAKVAGNPNSATDQWFINLADNTANLDNQNGGFTAFGRVCANGMGVLDAMAAVPTASYTVNVAGSPTQFDDFPIDTAPPAPASLDFSKLLTVNSITQIEPVVFSITGNSGGSAVLATTDGTNITLTPNGLLAGTNLISILATDLDGNIFSQTITAVVASAYSDWIAANSLAGVNASPADDPDSDGLSNASEFLLGGSPASNDAAAIRPRASTTSVSGQRYPALGFTLRKNTAGILATVESAPDIFGAAWTPIWTNTVSSSPLTITQTDQGDRWQMLIRDTAPLAPGAPHRFLRLRIALPQ